MNVQASPSQWEAVGGFEEESSLRTPTTSCRGHAVTLAAREMRHLGSTTPVMDWEGVGVGDGEARSA